MMRVCLRFPHKNCLQNAYKFEQMQKRKISNKLYINKLEISSSGTTRNRTGDTRIFSPLLYQLSYGTICGCKDRYFFLSYKLFIKKSSFFRYLCLEVGPYDHSKTSNNNSLYDGSQQIAIIAFLKQF